MDIECIPVRSARQLEDFIQFPHDLYKNDPLYVPEIYAGQKRMFTKKTYPFYEYGDAALFLAYKNKVLCGRIAAIENPRYNAFHGSRVGFFGFFDCVDDKSAAKALFDAASDFAVKKGHSRLVGPVNYTTNETAGLLVQGFDSSPVVMMTYNFLYYQDLFESAGFEKEMDLLAYYMDIHTVDKRCVGMKDKLESRLLSEGISVRAVTRKSITNDAIRIQSLYNAAWEKNWGFVPFTPEEFSHLKADLLHILDTDFVYIAEKDGKAIGFSITIPDVNEILIHNKRGRLFPFGIVRLLFGKSKTQKMRVLALGVEKPYRQKGIEALFFARNILAAQRKNKIGAEASWILENNLEMNRALVKLNGKVYKTYRLYGKNLDD